MSWTGEPGEKGYVMSREEILSNMARLSLTGKLSLAKQRYNNWPGLIPYYDWIPEIKPEDLLRQIVAPHFPTHREILEERTLSILLKNHSKAILE